MIKSVKITSGFAAELPALKGKTLGLGPGFTVVFGPNGCGKSTLLRMLGAYASIAEDGGWSGPVEPTYLRGFKANNDSFPAVFKELAPGKCDAEVDWDGVPAFLHMSAFSDAPMMAFGMPSDGLVSDSERLSLQLGKASAGQNRLFRLQKLFDTAKRPPDLTKVAKWKDYNDLWRGAEKHFVSYVKKLPRDGTATLLLDEPDRSLDICNQAAFWTNIMPRVGAKVQVIVATHSPFALLVKGATIIDMIPGTADQARKAIVDAVNAWQTA
jgi:predicted ATPase